MARWMKDNPHAAGNLGDAIPRLLRSVGFDCTEVGTRRHRLSDGSRSIALPARPDDRAAVAVSGGA